MKRRRAVVFTTGDEGTTGARPGRRGERLVAPMAVRLVPSSAERRPESKSIEVTVETPTRLFHELDPSPLVGRDLDEQVEAYILACAREMNAVHYSLVLHVPATEMPGETAAAALSDAIRAYFQYRRDEEARKLQALMRDGRQALAIGIAFLFVCGLLGWIALRELAAPLGTFLDEGLLIIGWVALWRPLEILLYDWRPIRRERRVLDALGRMPVAFRRS